MRLKILLKRGATLALISVLLNGYLVLRLGSVEKRLRDEVQYARMEASQATMQVRDLSSQLRRMQDEQKWLAQESLDAQALTNEGVTLTGTFDFRSLPRDAQVLLQLRPAETSDWHEVATQKAGDLTYKAEFTVSPDLHYEYRLLAQGQSGTQASEISMLPPQAYRRPPLEPSVSYSNHNGKVTSTSIALYLAGFPAPFPEFKPVAASLEARPENGSVFKQDFAPGGHPEKEPFVLENISLPPRSNLFVTVRYADGHEVTKRIGHVRETGEPFLVGEPL